MLGKANELKQARLMFKALGEDSRLRMVNLLNKRSMNVDELCQVLDSEQSNISKHLTKLRFTGIVSDRRKGQFIYYSLIKSKNLLHQDLINCITKRLSDSEIFKKDLNMLKKLKNADNKD